MSERPPSGLVAHAGVKAAALLAGVLALIVGFVLFVMQARGVFEPTQALTLVADNAEGVTVGMDLTFSGFPIGRVRRIELAGTGKAHLTLDIPRKDAHWLRASSVFTLERGLVGDTRIRAFSNVLDDPPLADGAERPVLIGDARDGIPRMVATMQALLDNLQRLSDPDAPLARTLAHAERLGSRLNGPHGVLGGVLGDDRRAARLIADLSQAVAGTARLVDEARTRLLGPDGVAQATQASVLSLRQLLDETRVRLTQADAILADVKAITGNARAASDDLGVLRAEIDANLRRTSALIDEINRRWPFARERTLTLP